MTLYETILTAIDDSKFDRIIIYLQVDKIDEYKFVIKTLNINKTSIPSDFIFSSDTFDEYIYRDLHLESRPNEEDRVYRIEEYCHIVNNRLIILQQKVKISNDHFPMFHQYYQNNERRYETYTKNGLSYVFDSNGLHLEIDKNRINRTTIKTELKSFIKIDALV